jgi:putative flippase GtrA
VRWRGHARKLRRYASVSVLCTVLSVALLAVLVDAFHMTAAWSNVVAVSASIPIAFELSRRWIWPQRNRRRVIGQVAPFALSSLAGLVVSTLAIHVVAGATRHWSTVGRTVALELATLSAFGLLWLANYVLNDRILFRERPIQDGQLTRSS